MNKLKVGDMVTIKYPSPKPKITWDDTGYMEKFIGGKYIISIMYEGTLTFTNLDGSEVIDTSIEVDEEGFPYINYANSWSWSHDCFVKISIKKKLYNHEQI